MKYFYKWEPIKHGVPQGSVLGPLFLFLYINNLPKIISDISKPIWFADDTSIIITNSSPSEFKKNTNHAFIEINNWFKSTLLSLNFDKTHFLQFRNKNSQEIQTQILYENKQMNNAYNTKFLKLVTESSMSWKVHIEELTSKLKKNAILLNKPFISLEVSLMFTLL